MANHKKKQQSTAEQLYIYADMSQKDIAVYLEVSENTVSKWKTDGKWDELKGAKTLTKDEIIKNYYLITADTLQRARDDKRSLTSGEADSLYKIACSIDKLDKTIKLPQVIAVFKKFNEWLAEENLEAVKNLTEFQKQFIRTFRDE